jgi:CDP-paratose 2-epimerase
MRILITGGCGFIGSNSAVRFLALGHEVTVVDNLSRAGARLNLTWLQGRPGFRFIESDVRNAQAMNEVLAAGNFDAVLHLAAQVAVTTSVIDPRADCDINILGTLNLLEAVRTASPHTIVLNASTNKVYGKLASVPLEGSATGYTCPSLPLGVPETQPLEFYSPYGCSKGAGDQYTIDYSRIYGLRTATLRQSCIYGYRQFGIEDQGWVAWFIIAHVLGKPITLYGDGRQVRDILFIDDLVDVYLKAFHSIDRISGQAFNIGGGAPNALSLIEFLKILGEISGRPVEYGHGEWRPGDQLYYVSDIRKASQELGWSPAVGAREGIVRLYEWIAANKALFGPAAAGR